MTDAGRTGGPGRPLVLLFSDSLAMPREFLETEERTVYGDTYPARLRSLLTGHADVDAVSSVGLDSENALYEARFQVLPRRPNVLVLHLGINDCAPRVFRKGSTSVLLRPWFGRLTRGYAMRAIHALRPLICRARKLVYVDANEFEANLRVLLDRLTAAHPGCTSFAIAISDKPDHMERRSPGYRANVARYNQALRRVFGDRLVDVNALLPLDQQLISDGIHLTVKAHDLLAKVLAERVESALRDSPGTGRTSTAQTSA
jgi:lysophospholipase L1-like esterase